MQGGWLTRWMVAQLLLSAVLRSSVARSTCIESTLAVTSCHAPAAVYNHAVLWAYSTGTQQQQDAVYELLAPAA